MLQFWVAESACIGVLNVLAASSWYIDKLGLQRVVVSMGDGEAVSLGFSAKDTTAIILVPRRNPPDEGNPMLYASNIEKAHGLLSSRGVSVGEIETDRQGTRYFVMHDLDGNQIEITQEP
jgi:hypothetical protein